MVAHKETIRSLKNPPKQNIPPPKKALIPKPQMKKHHLPIDQHNYHNSRKLGGRPAVAQELAVAVLREQ